MVRALACQVMGPLSPTTWKLTASFRLPSIGSFLSFTQGKAITSLIALCPAGTVMLGLASKVTGRLECGTSTLPLDCKASSTSSKVTGLLPKAFERRMRAWPPHMSGRTIRRKL